MASGEIGRKKERYIEKEKEKEREREKDRDTQSKSNGISVL